SYWPRDRRISQATAGSLISLCRTIDLRLEITNATGLLADAGFERFLGGGRFGAGFGKIVGKAHDLTLRSLCSRIIGVLADRIVRRNLQLLDIRADHDGALVGGNMPSGKLKQ